MAGTLAMEARQDMAERVDMEDPVEPVEMGARGDAEAHQKVALRRPLFCKPHNAEYVFRRVNSAWLTRIERLFRQFWTQWPLRI